MLRTLYAEKPCLELLEQGKYQNAIQCMTQLHKQSKRHSHLLGLGLLYEKVGEHHTNQRAGEACYYFDYAIRLYKSYLQQKRQIKKEQRVYLQQTIHRLVRQMGYANLTVTSLPGVARIILQGVRRKWVVLSPYRFDALCPGNYRLVARRKGFTLQRKVIQLKQRQTLLQQNQSVTGSPSSLSECQLGVGLLWELGGLGLAGGVLYFAAENRATNVRSSSGTRC